MRPLICDCSKIPKPGKNIRDASVLGWGWPIFPNIEKPKEPAAKAVNSWKEWLSILTAKSRTWKRARSFIIHTNVFIACGSKLQLTAIKCREVSSIPSFRTWAKHPQFGLLWAPNKGNLRVTVTLFGRMASVVTEHNVTAQISSVWWTLAFHLLKYNRMSSIYFHFRSEAIWFSSRFFWAKRKIGLSYDPVSQRIWIPPTKLSSWASFVSYLVNNSICKLFVDVLFNHNILQ